MQTALLALFLHPAAAPHLHQEDGSASLWLAVAIAVIAGGLVLNRYVARRQAADLDR
ncbi:MAG: hypothetical protein AAGA54_14730 [Myxococcota bacterium]